MLVELINNSIKYSQATNINISFDYDDKNLNLKYFEDGIGFDYKQATEKKSGFGLLNLENRINKLGGKYKYETSAGKGVRVHVQLKTEYV